MMKPELESALTPAAQQLLSEVVTDYRTRVLAAAEASAAQSTGEVREISVHDILAGLASAQERKRTRRSQIDRALYLYMVVGGALSLVSLTLWALRYATTTRDLRELLPLLTGLSGVLLFFLAFTLQRLRALREQDQTQSSFTSPPRDVVEMQFIAAWRDIELGLRRVAASRVGESAISVPLSQLIEGAVVAGAVSRAGSQQLRALLQLRNRILHGGERIPGDDLRAAIRDAEEISAALGSGPLRRVT